MTKRILLLSETIGHDEDLGHVLMKNFLHYVALNDEPPIALMMMNTAVKLACEGSEVLSDLQSLADKGVAVTSCKTCLEYFHLVHKVAVGSIGGMPVSVPALLGDDTVLTVA